MREDIKELLKRYDEIGALILEQKLDEFGDKLDQKPDGVDDVTYEEQERDIPYYDESAFNEEYDYEDVSLFDDAEEE